jgi:hypothetical protein
VPPTTSKDGGELCAPAGVPQRENTSATMAAAAPTLRNIYLRNVPEAKNGTRASELAES